MTVPELLILPPLMSRVDGVNAFRKNVDTRPVDVTLLLLKVIPPMLLDDAVPVTKLLDRVVAELLILPPLISSVVGVKALRR